MPDCGFSERFIVCLTPDGEMRTVMSETSLQIFFRLVQEEMSVTDISSELSIPKTTAQTIMGKMETLGILASRKDESDRRRTVFRTAASPIYMDSNSIRWRFMSVNSAVDDLMSGTDHPMLDAVALWASVMNSHGLDVWPLVMDFGMTLGTHVSDRFKESSVDEVLQFVTHLFRESDVSIDVGSGIEVSLRSNGSKHSNGAACIGPMIGMLIVLLRNRKGLSYVPMLKIVSMNPAEIVMKARPFKGVCPTDADRSLHRLCAASHPSKDEFGVWFADYSAIMITNPTMIRILDCISEKTCTVTSISERIGIPRPSIYAALKKLIDLRLVVFAEEEGKRDKAYSLSCLKVLGSKGDGEGDPKRITTALDQFVDGRIGLFDALAEYVFYLKSSTGIETDWQWNAIGRAVGRSVRARLKEVGYREYLEIILSMILPPNSGHIVEDGSILIESENNSMIGKKGLCDLVFGAISEFDTSPDYNS